MQKQQFIKKEVAEILEIRPSQVQYYTDKGIITPDIFAPKGRGTRRVYSIRNLIEFLIAKRAIEHGVSIESAARIISGLKSYDEGLAPNDEDFYQAYEDAFWSIESWRDRGSTSVFLIYEQRYDFKEFIQIHYYAITDLEKDRFKIEISHHTKSMYIINLTDIVDGIMSKLDSA